jgi:hypothetical protein
MKLIKDLLGNGTIHLLTEGGEGMSHPEPEQFGAESLRPPTAGVSYATGTKRSISSWRR